MKKILKKLIPLGLIQLAELLKEKWCYSKLILSLKDKELYGLLHKNVLLKERHKGKRCFILATGGSINETDVSFLQDEYCIFLSQFYFHEKYHFLTKKRKDKYHLFSGFCLHDDLNVQQAKAWYQQIEEKVLEETPIFLPYQDKQFIDKYNFLKGKETFFFAFNKPLTQIKDGIDATSFLYGAQNIPIMAVQLAIYMGFKEIYILGVDNCYAPHVPYTHFYDDRLSVVDYKFSLKNYSPKSEIDLWAGGLYTIPDSKVLESSCRGFLQTWEQWKLVKIFADASNILIKNASSFGLFDIFPRVDYQSLFKVDKNQLHTNKEAYGNKNACTYIEK